MRKIFIHASGTENSQRTVKRLKSKLDNVGFTVIDCFCEDAEMMVCIGGDGTFLEAVHKYNFPTLPIIGINTGHLGFFQEIMPDKLDDFIFNYTQGKYSIQTLSAVKAKVIADGVEYEHTGLNEVVVTGGNNHVTHLNMSIGGSFIERYSGDGLLISSPAGSTAYNYSLGGSIVDPRLKLLQVTPMAPMNTTAYRSFTSSILLPFDLSLGINPDFRNGESEVPIKIICDGYSTEYHKIDNIEVSFSEKNVNLMRFEGYDFWTKVKSKFL